jgi:hypothetical protein
MERIKRVDADAQAAARRVTLAALLSLLLHAGLMFVGPQPLAGMPASGAPLRVATLPPGSLSATLLPGQAAAVSPVAPLQTARAPLGWNVETPDARYYPAEELDVLPVPRRAARLAALSAGSERLRLLARIDASGRIVALELFDSTVAAASEQAAMAALRQTVFAPARRAGRSVRSEVVIELADASRH